MITLKELEFFKSQDIKNTDIDNLVDISDLTFNIEGTEIEKTLDFINKVKNPYFFKVGDIAVRVRFQDNAPSLQKCVENLLTKID